MPPWVEYIYLDKSTSEISEPRYSRISIYCAMIYLTDCGLSLLAEITRMLALDGDPRIDPNRKLFSPYSDRGQVTLSSWWKSVGRFIFLGTLAAATLLGLLTPGLGIAIFGWPSHAACGNETSFMELLAPGSHNGESRNTPPSQSCGFD